MAADLRIWTAPAGGLNGRPTLSDLVAGGWAWVATSPRRLIGSVSHSATLDSASVIATPRGAGVVVNNVASAGVQFGQQQPIPDPPWTILIVAAPVATASQRPLIDQRYASSPFNETSIRANFRGSAASTNSGSLGAYFSGGGGFSADSQFDGAPHSWVLRKAGFGSGLAAIWRDGAVQVLSEDAGTGSNTRSTNQKFAIGNLGDYTGTGFVNPDPMLLALVVPRALSDGPCRALSADPFGVAFKPRRIWVPVSAGGGALDLTQTTGVALSGSVSVSGDIQIGTNFNLVQSSVVGLAGSLATTGDVQIGTTFNLAQTANVGLSSSVGVSGDIQILSGSLDLAQTAAVAMSGTVGLSGDIQIGTSFNLAQTAAVGLTGSVGTTGDVQIGTSFDLAQSVALAMSGSVAVSGDLQSGTAPVITQSFGNFGWDPRKRLSWKRKELREELEAALDDAPKAVKELVEAQQPLDIPDSIHTALSTVRHNLRSRGGSAVPLKQEIDELHEALETVATFTREREAARQARRRKQQHLLLLS